jgi:glyoxylase-like metal-dependent hydrolase (beta-lactamase superfamily II)
MAYSSYEAGPRELGNGVYAYLQPSGGWGLSNAGLVVDSDSSLLIDTLFDRAHTELMLAEMRRISSASDIDIVVNTHANGDHCWGNELVRGARRIASAACAEEMSELLPKKLALLMRVARPLARLGRTGPRVGAVLGAIGWKKARVLCDAAPFALEAFGRFDFEGIELAGPTETFSGHCQVPVGDKTLSLWELGPAHTRGDVVVHVPHARTVFTGDIVFAEAHPAIWQGPISHYLKACEFIEKLDVDIVVPGHGPVTDMSAVRQLRDYLAWLMQASRERFDASLDAESAALDLQIPAPFDAWTEPERLVVNVAACYREFAGVPGQEDTIDLFGAMGRWRRKTHRFD